MTGHTRVTVGILIFEAVEVLDFAGPFEVFSRTRLVAGADSRRNDDSAPFETFTVAQTHAAVNAIGGHLLASIDGSIQVQPDRRVVHDGVFTSAGVSAGLDMSFAVVEQICGRTVAAETAHYIEYPWGRDDVPKHQDAV